MKKECICTGNAPEAIGPYSQAVRAGNLIFISGQIPIDPTTGKLVSSNIEDQTRQCMKNIVAVLESEGLSLENLLKTTIYVRDLDNFGIINDVYGSFLEKNHPARACVEVSGLPKNADVEIEAIAMA